MEHSHSNTLIELPLPGSSCSICSDTRIPSSYGKLTFSSCFRSMFVWLVIWLTTFVSVLLPVGNVICKMNFVVEVTSGEQVMIGDKSSDSPKTVQSYSRASIYSGSSRRHPQNCKLHMANMHTISVIVQCICG